MVAAAFHESMILVEQPAEMNKGLVENGMPFPVVVWLNSRVPDSSSSPCK